MRIAIIAPGSRGDVQPMAALALELKRRGHEVLFAARPNFRNWIESLDLDFHPVGVDIQAAIKDVYKDAHRLKSVLEFVASVIDDQFVSLEQLGQGFDIYAGGGLQCAAQALAEKSSKPYVYIAYSPNMLRSSHHTPVFFSTQWFPRPINWLVWKVYVAMGNAAIGKVVNRGRHRLGLGPLSDLYSYVFEPEQVLLATDGVLGPKAPDMGDHIHVTGFLFLEGKEPLPEALKSFIESDSPPVYVGFGSVPIENVRATEKLLKETARLGERRLVVAGGPSAIGAEGLGDNCFVVGPVDHGKLFPHMAAVVHHGSAGTTSTAARAGVAQIVVPHAADQFYWAKQAEKTGLAEKRLPYKKLSAKQLAKAIVRTVKNSELAARARDFGAQLSARDGAGEAADFFEKLVGEA